MPRFRISVTRWNFRAGSSSFQDFVKYITQADTSFARHGVVLVSLHDLFGLPDFKKIVGHFERHHSYIQWIVAASEHDQVLKTLSGHLCQVISVTLIDVNAPLDGYRACEERQLIIGAETDALGQNVQHARRLPKNDRIVFATLDHSSNLCYKEEKFIPFVKLAYAVLNTTLVEACNNGETDSLLLDRRVDFVIDVSKHVSMRSYYGYVMLPPASLCFLSRRATPLPPSFVSCWLSFFEVFLILTPLALLLLLIIAVQARLRSVPATRQSNFIMLFASTYLGRTPAAIPNKTSTLVKVFITVWMFATFILVQFTQTDITASRSVPALSSEMKQVMQLKSRLDDGSTRPCMHVFAKNIIEKLGSNVSHLNSLLKVANSCGSECLTHNARDVCFPLARSGSYTVVEMCDLFEEDKGCSTGLVVGEEPLVFYLKWLPTHTRFPLRRENQKLMIALHESGLRLQYIRRRFRPCSNGTGSAVFDIPTSDYATIYLIGCFLSLLAFATEVAYRRCYPPRYPQASPPAVANASFARPGVVLVSWRDLYELRGFEKIVAHFERYHSYIQWIVAAGEHDQVLKTLSGHLCQVISVTQVDINAPLDGYRSLPRTPRARRNPNQYAHRKRTKCQKVCLKMTEWLLRSATTARAICNKSGQVLPFMKLVYAALNITLVEVCNNGETDSLLLDRRVDFVVDISKSVPMRSYYGWNFRAGRKSFEGFLKYITQDDVSFARPGVVLVSLRELRSLRGFQNVVTDFERYHSYIQWIIAAPDHDQVLKTLSGHLCQVFSVTYYDVNAPLDGYRSCEKRRAIPAAELGVLGERVSNAGRLPKDDRVVFAAQDNNFKLCYKKDKVMPLIRRAYATINTSLVEVCNNGETESLLLDRRVDFDIEVSKRVPMRSYYGYVMLQPSSLCFLSRRATPLPPSFVSSWLSFEVCLVMFPLALVLLSLTAMQGRLHSVAASRYSDWAMFFLSTYLGRSPAAIRNARSTVQKCVL
ncbi:hypothetical protein MRX96_048994 [Rhipicephalus microplus]